MVEIAVLGAVRQIQSAGDAARRELGWSAADRLAASALVHARATLAQSGAELALEGTLAEGRYRLTISRDGGGHRVLAVGLATSGHATWLEAVFFGGDFTTAVRRHGFVR